jgi:ArsR family transcriptional regulator
MGQAMVRKYQARASVIKAMAHPTRLLVIDELSKQERCVGEITAMVGADISTISKHLLVLKNAGLIEDHKRGQMVFYKLTCPCITRFFSCIETVLQDRAKKHMACAMA